MARPHELLLVAQGTPEDARKFFEDRWPEARAVSDTERTLYRSFGLERASMRQLLAPAVFRAAWKHRRHGVGLPVGDALLLSGAFVVAGQRVLFSHRSDNAADHPEWEELLRIVRVERGSVA